MSSPCVLCAFCKLATFRLKCKSLICLLVAFYLSSMFDKYQLGNIYLRCTCLITISYIAFTLAVVSLQVSNASLAYCIAFSVSSVFMSGTHPIFSPVDGLYTGNNSNNKCHSFKQYFVIICISFFYLETTILQRGQTSAGYQ